IVFDMAIYPSLFVAYLIRLVPYFAENHRGLIVGICMMAVCVALNLADIRVVGMTSLGLFFLLSAPFAALVILAPFKAGALAGAAPSHSTMGLLGGILVAMWNYMGWDNASTIAREVDRPQRTYPRAMIAAVVVVALSYVLPVLAVYMTGVPASAFETGSWANLGGLIGGNWLRVAIVLGGMMSGLGMFNALVKRSSSLLMGLERGMMCFSVVAHVDSCQGDTALTI